MSAPSPSEKLVDPDTDPGVAATVHLLHRRRGWGWTLGGSLIAFVAFVAIGVHFWPNASGTTGAICGLIITGLLALAAVALIAVIVDTVKLHRRHPLTRKHASGRTSYHPVYAHPFRTPHHRVSNVFTWVLLALWLGLAVGFLPDQVNGIAYVAGAGKTVTFLPQSYTRECGRSSCHNVTNGVLETTPPISATWQYQVPLGQPFSVRQPVWDGWGSPDLMDGVSAGGAMFGALIFDIPAILIIAELVRMVRRRLRRPRDAVSLVSGTS
jgi:hypothetical protein